MIKRYFYSGTKRNFSIATIWINGGGDMDSNCKKGINHLLCSLLTRGCEGFDNLGFSNLIESYGAELNHEVFEDGISISIKTLNAHFDKLFPLINLIINKPTLSEIQYQNVKNSTLNLIKKDKENPFNICFEKWRKIVYLKHPYAFNTYGYEKDLSNISYGDILSEYQKFKKREKILISNNSEINGDSFEGINQKILKDNSSIQNHNLKKELRFVSSYCESNQIIMMLGNQTCSLRSNEYLSLKVLESHLSYGMSSILFKLFREKNGITYDVGVFNSIRKGNAPFLVYLSVSNKNAILAFKILVSLWKELLFSLINKEKIFIAKQKLKSSFLISNQSLDEILQRKIQLISYGISPDLDNYYLSRIEAVTPEDINLLINKYLSKPYLSITGSKKVCLEIKNQWMKTF